MIRDIEASLDEIATALIDLKEIMGEILDKNGSDDLISVLIEIRDTLRRK